MDNMTPVDFIYSTQPLLTLSDQDCLALTGWVEAADQAVQALDCPQYEKTILVKGNAMEAEQDLFYIATEPAFLYCLMTSNQELTGKKSLRDGSKP